MTKPVKTQIKKAKFWSFVAKHKHKPDATIYARGFPSERHVDTQRELHEGWLTLSIDRGPDFEMNAQMTIDEAKALHEQLGAAIGMAMSEKACTSPTCYWCRDSKPVSPSR